MEEILIWSHFVARAVENLRDDYQEYRGMLLTEGDLECQLFRYLMREAPFNVYMPTQPDGVGNAPQSSYIHSKVTWLPGYKRKFFPDLTILNPNILNVDTFQNRNLSREMRLHKGFYHDGPAIGIEIKFLRNNVNVANKATEDYIHINEELIPAIRFHDRVQPYDIFFSVVGCKNVQYYNQAVESLNAIIAQHPPIWPFIYVCAFHQDEICWFPNA